MAFAIKKPECKDGAYSISVDTKHLYIKDLTGEYDVSANPGGWGAPNFEMAQSAVFALAVRKASAGDEVFAGNTAIFVYDPAAANDKITSFDMKFALDGVIKVVIGRLPVSVDGINTIDTVPVAITNGMYFYYQGDAWTKIAGVNTKVTDLTDLVDEPTIPQNSTEDALYPMLALEHSNIYKEYTLEEAKKSPDAEDIFSKAMHLYFELTQVSRVFWSGLTVQAQDKLETLITKYQLSSQ